MRPYGLTTAPKSDAYGVLDGAPRSRIAGVKHAHPAPKPGAYWPPGFRDWADACAARARAHREAPKPVKPESSGQERKP